MDGGHEADGSQRRTGRSLGVGLPAPSVAERAGGEMEAVGMAMGQARSGLMD